MYLPVQMSCSDAKQWQQQPQPRFSVAVLPYEAQAVAELLCVLPVHVVALQLYAAGLHASPLQAWRAVSARFHVSVQLCVLQLSFPAIQLAL